jgi:hypothetical protein
MRADVGIPQGNNKVYSTRVWFQPLLHQPVQSTIHLSDCAPDRPLVEPPIESRLTAYVWRPPRAMGNHRTPPASSSPTPPSLRPTTYSILLHLNKYCCCCSPATDPGRTIRSHSSPGERRRPPEPEPCRGTRVRVRHSCHALTPFAAGIGGSVKSSTGSLISGRP